MYPGVRVSHDSVTVEQDSETEAAEWKLLLLLIHTHTHTRFHLCWEIRPPFMYRLPVKAPLHTDFKIYIKHCSLANNWYLMYLFNTFSLKAHHIQTFARDPLAELFKALGVYTLCLS